MMKRRWTLAMLLAAMVGGARHGAAQTTTPATTAASTAPAVDPEVRAALQLLQDRKETLKDFTADIDFSVDHTKSDYSEGQQGTVDFKNDPATGPQFSARFLFDTDGHGHPVKKHPRDVVFDGTNVTVIDRAGKTFERRNLLPPGAKPGEAVTLNGPMPLPIGVKVDDVLADFEVTLGHSTNPDEIVLKLVPRASVKGKFDFREMELTIDRKLQVPVKVTRIERNRDVTRVSLKNFVINSDKAAMVDTTVPTGGDWTIDLGK